MSDNVQCRVQGACGRITLTRPKAIHALTLDMCEAMSAALLAWLDDDAVQSVIIEHEGGTRGFCAGGDVALLRNSAIEDGGRRGRAFFHAEYRLNHLLFTYSKPTVAFMDGTTMGGGVGISQPCRYRVATQNTKFAMPEGAIGLFPDVGAGWYLPRLPGHVGRFLALTGARLDGAECLWSGLATHYADSDRLDAAKQAMVAGSDLQTALGEIAASAPEARLAGNAQAIDRLFAADTLEGIMADLQADGGDWAAKELAAVTGKCPATGKVALRQFAANADCETFADNMAMEYRIAARMIMRSDFAEGVRAVLIDKTGDPEWSPATPEDITEAMVDTVFAPLPDGEEWTPFPQASAA